MSSDFYSSFAEENSSVFARYTAPFLCALAGFLAEFTVGFVGALPVGEIVLLAVFPIAVIARVMKRRWSGVAQRTRWFRICLIAIAVMALGYIISDLYRGSPTGNLVRGWSRVAFLGIDLIAVTYLVGGGWRNLWIFLVCAALGQAASALITGPLADEYWKFGVGFPITVVAIFLTSNLRFGWPAAVAFLLGLVHIALGFRSMGGVCLLLGSILIVREIGGRWRIPIGVVLFAISAALVVLVRGHFEDEDAHKSSNIERQSMIETSVDLFLDSPFIGQGSWFTTRQISKIEAHRAKLDETFTQYTPEQIDKLSIHSQILVTLAEGGILGGAFFFVYGFILVMTFWLAWGDPTPRRAFIMLLVLDGAWNFMMSPFSGAVRIWIALYVALGLLLWQERRAWRNGGYLE